MNMILPTILAEDHFNHFYGIGLLILMAAGFGISNIILTTIIGPSRNGKIKGSTYESGVNPIGSARSRFNVRFFVVAMTFLVFDVEIIFLYPWATVFPNLTDDGQSALFFGRMLFFVFTSVIAFVYSWKKGVFKYD